MQSDIKFHNKHHEFYTDERCFITEVANDNNDEQVSIALARVEPGITTAWHKLDGVTERYLIISGTGRVEVGDLEAREVSVGDIVRIAANTPQRITNVGDTDLVFYAICSPRFVNHCYINLE